MTAKTNLYRVLGFGAVIFAVIASLGAASASQGSPIRQESEEAGLTVPYHGRLTDPAGNPVADGFYDLRFILFSVETGGEPLWEETQVDVQVKSGEFSVLLGSQVALQKDLIEGGSWLEVAVRGPDENPFTSLAPRKRLSEAALRAGLSAASGLTCPHDHTGEHWIGSGTDDDGLRVENPKYFGNGLVGIASNGSDAWGVLGYSVPGIGVRGNSETGTGVHGNSISGNGVFGISSSGDGVSGNASASNKSGVYGYNSGSGFGVVGQSISGWGMESNGNDAATNDRLGDLRLGGYTGEIFAFGTFLNLFSDKHIYLDLDDNNDDANAYFRIVNGTNSVIHEISEDGTKSAILRTEDYGQRAVYTMESPEVWLEDFGSASLADGMAKVTLEPIFAQTVNLEVGYHVFVTPICQVPVFLYVTAKDSSGFTVQGRGLDGQPAVCDFDYRIVAKRTGLEPLRLEPLDLSDDNKSQK